MQQISLNQRRLLRQYWQEPAIVRHYAAVDGNQTLAERLAWQDVLRRYLIDGRRRRLVDVGSGAGALTLLLAEMQQRAIGVDWSPPLLAVARQRAWERQLPCVFMEADAEQVPLPGSAVDGVVARRVLSELQQPQAALTEWLRILKPGGRLLIIERDWSNADCAQIVAEAEGGLQSPLQTAAEQQRRQLPLWRPLGATLTTAVVAAGFDDVQSSTLAGQLTQSVRRRGRDFSCGYTLVSAVKPGSRRLNVVQNGSS